jgi:hypothetical protein
MIKQRVPFFANTEDDTHCYQAAIASVLKYFQPNKSYSFKDLDKMSAKKEGLWTWQTQMIINLLKEGFDVVDIDSFDILAFVKDGGEYLRKKYGDEVAKQQIKNSDIVQEQRLYAEYLKLNKHIQRIPKIDDIKSLLAKGYLVVCNINSRALSNKDGYVGHYVVIFQADDKDIYFHDPGLPPLSNRKETIENFTRVWAYPNVEAKNLTAFKLA